MKQNRKKQPEIFWPGTFLKKWLNISSNASDFKADPQEGDSSSDSDVEPCETLPKCRRRNSETFRAQYINTKELRICVGTWNVGGKLPPEDLDISDCLEMDEPADMYVIGFQEIVPLNAGNVFGAEDSRPVPRWENIIRETLNRIQPEKPKFKCYSDPPSPSRFKASDDAPPDIINEILAEIDSDRDEELYQLDEESTGSDDVKGGTIPSENEFVWSEASNFTENVDRVSSKEHDVQRKFSSPKSFDRLIHSRTEGSMEDPEPSPQQKGRLSKTISGTERVRLIWPEPPMDLLAKHVLERSNSLKSVESFRASKSFKFSYSLSSACGDYKGALETALRTNIDLKAIKRRKRSPFVRIVSKKMVGIFLSIWIRGSLRRHIQNVKVSTVGVGVMGYIGNKGSVSVSMSVYQTLFCFICSHLTAGEKDGDEHKRNADVQEIHRRTHFKKVSGIRFPKTILDHETQMTRKLKRNNEKRRGCASLSRNCSSQFLFY